MSEIAIQVEHLTKTYKLYTSQKERLKESMSITGKRYHTQMYALRDLHFNIYRGESVGIIGTNGSGKSTLLKIITGVLNATYGQTIVNGKLAALLELGAGFNMEYTGIENVFLNGMVMGYSRDEMEKKLDAITAFADIGEFIHQPVKTYSSGMFVRLAFATQIFADPDVLIVDEALSVGDIRFQQKCYRAMEQMMENKTVLLVTHDPSAVLRFCSRVIWLEKGKVMYDGGVDEGVRRYQSFLIDQGDSADEQGDALREEMQTDRVDLERLPIRPDVQRAGNGKANITACGLYNQENQVADIVEPGLPYIFAMRLVFLEQVPSPIVGITVKNRLGESVLAFHSDMSGARVDASAEEKEYLFSFNMPPLNYGEYTISPAVASGTHSDHIQLCWLHDAWVFTVKPRRFELPGILYTEEIQVRQNSEGI